jgi:hypothetical protein
LNAPIRHPIYAAPCDHGRTPNVQLAIDERSRWLREAAERHFTGASHHEQARRLHRALANYATSAWLREGSLSLCPPRHKGRLTEYCWMILKSRDHVPSERNIRRILRGRATRGPSSEV